jgi:hypothetical protein
VFSVTSWFDRLTILSEVEGVAENPLCLTCPELVEGVPLWQDSKKMR